MERLIFLINNSGKKQPINPEKYGAVKSQAREYKNPLWLEFEPPRGFSQ